VSVATRKLIAAATALGLCLSVVTQAIGAPAHPPAKQRSGGRQSGAETVICVHYMFKSSA